MTPGWSREVAYTAQAPCLRVADQGDRTAFLVGCQAVSGSGGLRSRAAELWKQATDELARLAAGTTTVDALLAELLPSPTTPAGAGVPQPHPLLHPHSAITASAEADNRDAAAGLVILPLATPTASIDPAVAYDPLWWRRGYSRYVAKKVDGLYSSTVGRAGAELGVDFDPDDPTIVDALDELDDTADGWGAGLGLFVEKQVRDGVTAGDTVDGLAARLRDSDDSWFGIARSALLASVAVATTYNRAALAAGTSARAQGTSSTKTWNCVLPDSRIAGIGVSHAARRWHRGRVARLSCISGARLGLTAEHPVLTMRGWVRADELHPGDQLVRYVGGDRPESSADPDVSHNPPSAFEVFQAAHESGPAERMVGNVVDFDGDGERAKVDVVSVDGLLRDRLQAPFGEKALEKLLPLTDADLETLLAGGYQSEFLVAPSSPGHHFDRRGAGVGEPLPLLRPPESHHAGFALRANPASVQLQGHADGGRGGVVLLGERDKRRSGVVVGDDGIEVAREGGLRRRSFGGGGDGARLTTLRPPVGSSMEAGALPPGAECDPGSDETPAHRAVVASDGFGDFLERLAGLVELDDLVDVQLHAYEGWVHDFSTAGHWYLTDAIIVHNSVGDDRVRDTHADMDGQSVDIGEDFLVAGVYPAAGPHDERLPVELVANCRCVLSLSGDGGSVADESTDVQDDGAASLDYATDGTEEDALVAGAQLHTHGHCERCGGWLEGRSYCAKCGRGYTGPLLDAGSAPPDPTGEDPLYDQGLSPDTMHINEDVGLVATDGVDQEDAADMTTTAPSSGVTYTSGVTVATNDTGGLDQLVQRFQTSGAQLADGTIGMVPWRGVLAVEGRPTGDGRMFRQGSLRWDEGFLPTDLFAMLSDPDGGYGHDGSSICGRIDRMWKQPATDGAYTEIWGEGVYDTGTPTGAEVFRLQQNGMLTGVSIDVDSVEVVMPDITSEDDLLEVLFGGGVEEYSAGRIRRATVCSIPAFIEARIFPVSDTGALVASAASEGFRELRVCTPWERGETQRESLVASAGAFSAQPKAKEADVFHSPLVDSDPPANVFARQEYRQFTPYEVDAEGRVQGHVSPWGECHISYSDRCVTAPRSRTGYLHARTGRTLTAEGDIVATARVYAQFGHGRAHAPEELAAAPAVEWYENQTLAVADVAIFEDAHGIQIQGRVRPGATRAQVVALRCSRISPDWRSINGSLECVGLAVVNVSGFTNSSRLPALVASAMEAGLDVPDLDADLRGSAFLSGGEVLTLVASGGPTRDPAMALVGVVRAMAERLEALEQAELARQRDALLAGLPTEADEQAELAAQMSAILDGVDLDVEAAAVEAAAETSDAPTAGLSAEELDTLRAALAITERLTARPTDGSDLASGDTITCPNCGETGIPADATECPRCGESLDGVSGSDNAAEVLVAACSCSSEMACSTCSEHASG